MNPDDKARVIAIMHAAHCNHPERGGCDYPSYDDAVFLGVDHRGPGRPRLPRHIDSAVDDVLSAELRDACVHAVDVKCMLPYIYASVTQYDSDHSAEVFIMVLPDQVVAVGHANHNDAPFVLSRHSEFFSSHTNAPDSPDVITARTVRQTIRKYIRMFTLPTKEGEYCRDDTDDDDFAEDLRAAVVDTFGGYLLEHTPELVGAFHSARYLKNFDHARLARHEYASILNEFIVSRDTAQEMAVEYFIALVHEQYTLTVEICDIITEFVPRWPYTHTETLTYSQFARHMFGGAYRIDKYIDDSMTMPLTAPPHVHYDKLRYIIGCRTPDAKIILLRRTRRMSTRF